MPFLTFIGQQCASLLTPRLSQMCLLFLVRPTRGRSMGDILSPQSFALRPPTGGYDSSDLLRRSQTMCIRNMDPLYHLLRRSQTMCIRNMGPSYHLLRRSQTMCIRNMGPSYHLLRRSQTMCIRNMGPLYHLLRRSQQMTMTFRSQA